MDFTFHLKRVSGMPDFFRPVRFGNAAGPVVSIQASRRHYSTPRATHSDLSKYTMFEVSLTREDAIKVVEASGLTVTSFGGDVRGYMPKDQVQQMFDLLVEKFGEPSPI